MPYIKICARQQLLEGERFPEVAGELAFIITSICIDYFNSTTANYQAINDIMGALEGAKLELYPRLAASYEDLKLQANGDVYDSKISTKKDN